MVGLLIIGFEWPKINKGYKKEKIALVVFTAIGWALWLLLILFPGLPGPTVFLEQMIRFFAEMVGL